MKKLIISASFLVLFGFGLTSEVSAQTVPALIKKEILSYLKKRPDCNGEFVTVTVESVKIGPRKIGYIGSCRHGGGPSILYEKTSSGLRKLLEVDVGMNGGFEPSETVSKGYYDMSQYESGGGEVCGTTYRWNGSRYFKYKGDC